jgi:O-antigen/teichoic acid export membrane protein
MKIQKQIFRNTIFLYVKLIITIIFTLVATRIVLNQLGFIDYGIYTLIGSTIMILSFLNAAMSVSTQRFIGVAMGTKNLNEIKKTFFSSISIHLLIGITVVVVLEIIYFFAKENLFNIPENRIESAQYIFQFIVISTFFTINSVPYDALIHAHEDFLVDSIIGILEISLKLTLAIILLVYPNDKLVFYGFLSMLIIILIRFIKSWYCFKKYEECSWEWRKYSNKKTIFKMLSFTLWNLFGSLANVLKVQGLILLLNAFLGLVVVSAYGIAQQINGQLYAITENFIKTLRPKIFKSEGENNREKMFKLAFLACKIGFYLFSFVSIPLIINMEFILTLWLKNVPKTTILFSQLLLIATLINLITIGLTTVITATGNIKKYQLIVSIITISNLPFAYLLLKNNFEYYSVLVLLICIEIIVSFARIIILKNSAGLNVYHYFNKVILKILVPLLLVFPIVFLTSYLFNNIIEFVLLNTIIILFFYSIFIFKYGLEKEEKKSLKQLFSKNVN